MGDNTLQTIIPGPSAPNDVNQYKTALSGDLLPRNAQGAPEDEAANLGSPTNQFGKLYIKESINVDGTQGGFCPAGVMLPYTASATVAPPGWIFAVGATIGNDGSGADFEGEEFRYLFDLYKVVSNYGNIGTEDFDSGDTVITPNPNGRFIRSTGTTNPDGTTIGGVQANQNSSHTHTYGRTVPVAASYGTYIGQGDDNNEVTTNTSSNGGNEARPDAMSFPYIIKV